MVMANFCLHPIRIDRKGLLHICQLEWSVNAVSFAASKYFIVWRSELRMYWCAVRHRTVLITFARQFVGSIMPNVFMLFP